MPTIIKSFRNTLVLMIYEATVTMFCIFELLKGTKRKLKNPNCDIFMPVPSNYFWLSIAGISSFLYYYNTRINIINDGSLKKWQIQLIHRFLPQITVLKHDSHLEKIKQYPELLEWSQKSWAAGKFLAPLFHSKKSKYLIIDCDILFLKKPTELISWIEKETKYSQYSYDCKNYSVLSKIEMQNLLKKECKHFNVNSGMVAIQKHKLPKNIVKKVYKTFLAMIQQMEDRLLTDTNDFPRKKTAVLDFCFGKSVIEQSLHAWLFNIVPTRKLSRQYTLAPFFRTNFHNESIPKDVSVIHFTGEKDKRLMYKYLFHSILAKLTHKSDKQWFNALPLNQLRDNVYPLFQSMK